jgi:hypothetical protein
MEKVNQPETLSPSRAPHPAQKNVAHFLYRFGTLLMLAYAGSSLVFILTIESTFNGGFLFAIKSLWLPLGLAIFAVTWWCRRSFASIPGFRGTPWIAAVILYPIMLLLAWPHMMALNAILPSPGEVVYEGPVIKKRESISSKGGRVKYLITIHDQATQETVTLYAPKWQFEQLSVGDTMKKTFSVGGLGLPFRWRYGKELCRPRQSYVPSAALPRSVRKGFLV